MNRRRLIQLCLLTSLRKRLWIAILLTISAGVGLRLAAVAWLPSLALEGLTFFSVVGAVLRSSYRRHPHEFEAFQSAPTHIQP